MKSLKQKLQKYSLTKIKKKPTASATASLSIDLDKATEDSDQLLELPAAGNKSEK